ncbi:hypothetical protein SNEBB_009040 [Seison nebaliae]|nr:hypothetical protein SNEBB_009040 [Seison nebaliae]
MEKLESFREKPAAMLKSVFDLIPGSSTDPNTSETTKKSGKRAKRKQRISQCIRIETGFGGAMRQMKIGEMDLQPPQPNQLLIRVKYSGLSFQDIMAKQGILQDAPKPPFVLGFEAVGEVEAVGNNVKNFKAGDRVYCISNYGAWAEYVCVPFYQCWLLPTNLNFKDAISYGINFLTAFALLNDVACIRDGQTILIHSVGGAVGTALLQLLNHVSVDVIGIASKNKHEKLLENKTVKFVYDRTETPNYEQEIRKNYIDGVDVVFDCMCGEDTTKGLSLLKPMGKYVVYGFSNTVVSEGKAFLSFATKSINQLQWWQTDKVNPLKLMEDNQSICGFSLRDLLFKQNEEIGSVNDSMNLNDIPVPYGYKYVEKTLTKIWDMAENKEILPVIDSTYDFEKIEDGMSRLLEHSNFGKVLLYPNAKEENHNESGSDTSGPDDDDN